MKIFKKVVKWIGLSIGSLLMLIILTGLCFRLFSPKAQPPGELVDIGGFKLHINSTGEKNNKPTLVIEAGAGIASEHYYWLGENLKDSIRVVRYDRAGLGYSDLSNTPRDPKTIARELHTLLEKAGESPPYILAGHSFGGLFIRVFTQLYPDEVAAMVFLDSSHPDQRERLNFPPHADIIWKLNIVAALGDLGILNLVNRTIGPLLIAGDVPGEITNRFQDYFANGKYLRGVIEEERWEKTVYNQSRESSEFGSLPIRVFTANKGYDGEKASPGWMELQGEIADLSTNNKHILVNGHHNSIYTKKENADIICQEVIQLLGEL